MRALFVDMDGNYWWEEVAWPLRPFWGLYERPDPFSLEAYEEEFFGLKMKLFKLRRFCNPTGFRYEEERR